MPVYSKLSPAISVFDHRKRRISVVEPEPVDAERHHQQQGAADEQPPESAWSWPTKRATLWPAGAARPACAAGTAASKVVMAACLGA